MDRSVHGHMFVGARARAHTWNRCVFWHGCEESACRILVTFFVTLRVCEPKSTCRVQHPHATTKTTDIDYSIRRGAALQRICDGLALVDRVRGCQVRSVVATYIPEKHMGGPFKKAVVNACAVSMVRADAHLFACWQYG